jgi:hypothetical protein
MPKKVAPQIAQRTREPLVFRRQISRATQLGRDCVDLVGPELELANGLEDGMCDMPEQRLGVLN